MKINIINNYPISKSDNHNYYYNNCADYKKPYTITNTKSYCPIINSKANYIAFGSKLFALFPEEVVNKLPKNTKYKIGKLGPVITNKQGTELNSLGKFLSAVLEGKLLSPQEIKTQLIFVTDHDGSLAPPVDTSARLRNGCLPEVWNTIESVAKLPNANANVLTGRSLNEYIKMIDSRKNPYDFLKKTELKFYGAHGLQTLDNGRIVYRVDDQNLKQLDNVRNVVGIKAVEPNLYELEGLHQINYDGNDIQVFDKGCAISFIFPKNATKETREKFLELYLKILKQSGINLTTDADENNILTKLMDKVGIKKIGLISGNNSSLFKLSLSKNNLNIIPATVDKGTCIKDIVDTVKNNLSESALSRKFLAIFIGDDINDIPAVTALEKIRKESSSEQIDTGIIQVVRPDLDIDFSRFCSGNIIKHSLDENNRFLSCVGEILDSLSK